MRFSVAAGHFASEPKTTLPIRRVPVFPPGRQDSSVNAGPKSSKSLLTVSILPKMTESHDDASTVILQVRPLIANKIHSSVNVLWKTWNA